MSRYPLENKNKDIFFMEEALKEAQKAFNDDEVPIGAIITLKNQIIARAHNQVERLNDSTAHAEILAITQAQIFLNNKWLNGCNLYVTIEPCIMCAGAIILARIEKLFFGSLEPKFGGFYSLVNVNKLKTNHKLKITKGLLQEESSQLIKAFFKNKRKVKNVQRNH